MTRHLSTISILNYVYGALSIIGGLVILVIAIAAGGILQSDLVQNSNDAPPEAVGGLIQGLGSGLGVMILLWGVLICLSGYWISKRRNRMGSIVIAALCCLSFPIGTALGIFTIVVLVNDEVKRAYGEA